MPRSPRCRPADRSAASPRASPTGLAATRAAPLALPAPGSSAMRGRGSTRASESALAVLPRPARASRRTLLPSSRLYERVKTGIAVPPGARRAPSPPLEHDVVGPNSAPAIERSPTRTDRHQLNEELQRPAHRIDDEVDCGARPHVPATGQPRRRHLCSTTTTHSPGARTAPPTPGRSRRLLGVLVAAALVAAGDRHRRSGPGRRPVLLSQGKTVTASSTENADYTPASARGRRQHRRRAGRARASDAQWLTHRPRRDRAGRAGRPELGGRLRVRLPDPDVGERHVLDERSTRRPPARAARRR